MHALRKSAAPLALATLAALGLAAPTAQAQANLITNGGFESGGPVSNFTLVTPGDTTTITGWTVDTGSDLGDPHGVVLTGTYWQAASGTNSIELNDYFGSGYGPGGIYQDVTVTPGRSYTLTFSGSGQPNAGPAVKQAQIFWYAASAAPGSAAGTFTFDVTGHTQSSMGWTAEGPLTLTATASTMRLRFVGTIPTNDDGGFAIDNVNLVAAAPEPSQAAALGLGVLGLAGLGVRARRRQTA